MKLFRFFVLFLLSAFAVSCITQQKMLMLQNGSGAVQDTLERRLISEYKLQSGDILDIKVSSLDPNSVAIFNKSIGMNFTTAVNQASLYVNGYIIDQHGQVNLPLVGEVEVMGMTLDSLNIYLSSTLEQYFKYFTVDAKLVNYRISVLGEVNSPGIQNIYNADVNVLQALAGARGISNYGNRRKIKIIRKAFNTNESEVIDLSKEEVIYSEYFYLMPNDVVYVEPLKAKATSLNVPLFALLVSAASFAILVVNSIGNN